MRIQADSVRAKLKGVLAIALAVSIAGCGDVPQTIMDPAGDNARTTLDLFVPILWLSFAIFIGVEGFIVYSMIRFRYRKGNDGIPVQTHGNTKLELLWTAIPAVIVVILAVMTFRVIAVQAAEPAPDAVQVEVVGNQWWWEFYYPELGITTANELYLPVGRDAAFTLKSNDVIHSFWFPRISGKMDMVPGRTNKMRFRPEKTGEYDGQCTEFCGFAHAEMQMRLFVVEQEGFDAWVARQKASPSPSTQIATRGGELVRTRGCAACHAIAGTDVQGQIGPELTAFGLRTTIGAGLVENTDENLAAWIRNPEAVKPGVKMPALGLNDEEIAAVVSYLKELK